MMNAVFMTLRGRRRAKRDGVSVKYPANKKTAQPVIIFRIYVLNAAI
jgi:hypothetical protein